MIIILTGSCIVAVSVVDSLSFVQYIFLVVYL